MDDPRVGGRLNHAPGFGTVDETLTSFEPTERSSAVTASGSGTPGVVGNIVGHSEIAPIDDHRSEPDTRITADVSGLRGAAVEPMTARNFGARLDGLLDDVRVVAETGDASAGTTEALARAGRRSAGSTSEGWPWHH